MSVAITIGSERPTTLIYDDHAASGTAPGGPGATEVAIDIKPGSFPNRIHPKSNGIIPVATLTTDTFNATPRSTL